MRSALLLLLLHRAAAQVLSVARSDVGGGCSLLSGAKGSCVREANCQAVLEGRIFPSLCSLPSSGVGVCCDFIKPSTISKPSTTIKPSTTSKPSTTNRPQTTPAPSPRTTSKPRTPSPRITGKPRTPSPRATTETRRTTTTTVPRRPRTPPSRPQQPDRELKKCGVVTFSRLSPEPAIRPRSGLDPSTPGWNPSRPRPPLPMVGIVGGQEEEQGRQPWVAALGAVSHRDGVVDLLCGATLVSPLSLLTAAHCVAGQEQGSLVVTLGQTNLESEEGEERKVVGVLLHPQWANITGRPENDLAVVRLDRPVDLAPACLPSSGHKRLAIQSRTQFKVPRVGVVSGWGSTGPGSSSVARLRTTQVELLDEESCKASYPSLFREGGGDLFCAKGTRTGRGLVGDACQGDSGGPLMVLSEQGDWVIEGVVAGGVGCGLARYPGVYVRVLPHRQWILANI